MVRCTKCGEVVQDDDIQIDLWDREVCNDCYSRIMDSVDLESEEDDW